MRMEKPSTEPAKIGSVDVEAFSRNLARMIEEGGKATLFLPRAEPRSARKAWIAGAVNPAGTVIVDDGAAGALRKGKSLLPAGVVGIEGAFERGDCIIVRTKTGIEAGRGLSAYASSDIHRIAGHKSGEIATILGYRGRDEITHRDDLVLSELPTDLT